jgi:ribonuclease-3
MTDGIAIERRRGRLRALLALAGVETEELEPFELAFTHASAVAEGSVPPPSNERLEFLGDAVLGYVVARHLFLSHPQASEGELAKRKASFASDAAITATAQRLRFDELLVLGQGERKNGGALRPSNLANAFEAFLAALALAQGIDAALAFLEREHLHQHRVFAATESDAKTALQEWTQAHFRSAPLYHDEGEEGPAHEPLYCVGVSLRGEVLARGSGRSKKAAQQAAAALALVELHRRA